MVEIVSSKVSITVGRFYFKYTVSKFQDRNIKCSATKVKHCNFHILRCLIQTICQRCCSWFVYDTTNIKSCNLSCFFSSLTLRLAEVGRNCNNGICYLLSKVIFGSFLHFLKYHSRNLLWSIQTTVYINTGSVVIATYNFI